MRLSKDKNSKRIQIDVSVEEFFALKKMCAYAQMTKAVGLKEVAKKMNEQFYTFIEKRITDETEPRK